MILMMDQRADTVSHTATGRPNLPPRIKRLPLKSLDERDNKTHNSGHTTNPTPSLAHHRSNTSVICDSANSTIDKQPLLHSNPVYDGVIILNGQEDPRAVPSAPPLSEWFSDMEDMRSERAQMTAGHITPGHVMVHTLASCESQPPVPPSRTRSQEERPPPLPPARHMYTSNKMTIEQSRAPVLKPRRQETEMKLRDILPLLDDFLTVDKDFYNYACTFGGSDFQNVITNCKIHARPAKTANPREIEIVFGESSLSKSKASTERFQKLYHNIKYKLCLEQASISPEVDPNRLQLKLQNQYQCLCSNVGQGKLEVVCRRKDVQMIQQCIREECERGNGYHQPMTRESLLNQGNSSSSFCAGYEIGTAYRVYIHQHEIIKMKVSAIVSEIGSYSQLDLDNEVIIAAGQMVNKACRDIIKKQKQLCISEIFKTAGGNLLCKTIYHLVCPQWPEETSKHFACSEQLQNVVEKVIGAAMKDPAIKSIAFSPIGSGPSCRIPPAVVAEALFCALINQADPSGEYKTKKEIHVVHSSDAILKLLVDMLNIGGFVEVSSGSSVSVTEIPEEELAGLLCKIHEFPSHHVGESVNKLYPVLSPNLNQQDKITDVSPRLPEAVAIKPFSLRVKDEVYQFLKNTQNDNLQRIQKKFKITLQSQNSEIVQHSEVELRLEAGPQSNQRSVDDAGRLLRTLIDKCVVDLYLLPRAFDINGNLKVILYEGNMIRVGVDAIIHSTDGFLKPINGLSKLIMEGGGLELSDSTRKAVQKKHGTFPLHDSVATVAGRLACSLVLHAVLFDTGSEYSSSDLKITLNNALHYANILDIKSILIPINEEDHIPLDIFSEVLAEVILKYAQCTENPNLKRSLVEIHVVDSSIESRSLMELNKRLRIAPTVECLNDRKLRDIIKNPKCNTRLQISSGIMKKCDDIKKVYTSYLMIKNGEDWNKNENEKSSSQPECMVCQDRAIDCALSCGHTFCRECISEIQDRAQTKKAQCPQCREIIKDIIKIYL